MWKTDLNYILYKLDLYLLPFFILGVPPNNINFLNKNIQAMLLFFTSDTSFFNRACLKMESIQDFENHNLKFL